MQVVYKDNLGDQLLEMKDLLFITAASVIQEIHSELTANVTWGEERIQNWKVRV